MPTHIILASRRRPAATAGLPLPGVVVNMSTPHRKPRAAAELEKELLELRGVLGSAAVGLPSAASSGRDSGSHLPPHATGAAHLDVLLSAILVKLDLLTAVPAKFDVLASSLEKGTRAATGAASEAVAGLKAPIEDSLHTVDARLVAVTKAFEQLYTRLPTRALAKLDGLEERVAAAVNAALEPRLQAFERHLAASLGASLEPRFKAVSVTTAEAAARAIEAAQDSRAKAHAEQERWAARVAGLEKQLSEERAGRVAAAAASATALAEERAARATEAASLRERISSLGEAQAGHAHSLRELRQLVVSSLGEAQAGHAHSLRELRQLVVSGQQAQRAAQVNVDAISAAVQRAAQVDVDVISAAVTDGVRELMPPLLDDSVASIRGAIDRLSESLPQRVAGAVVLPIVDAVAHGARSTADAAETAGARVVESLCADLRDAVTHAASTTAARIHDSLSAGVEGALRTANDAVSRVTAMGPQLQRTEDASVAAAATMTKAQAAQAETLAKHLASLGEAQEGHGSTLREVRQLIIVAQQQQRSERPPPDVDTIRAAVTDGVRELLPPLLHDSAASVRGAIEELAEHLPQRVADAVAPSIVNAVAPSIAEAMADSARGASEVAEAVGARVSELLRGDLQDAVSDAASTAAARVHDALAAGVEGALRTATDAVSRVAALSPQLQHTEDASLAIAAAMTKAQAAQSAEAEALAKHLASLGEAQEGHGSTLREVRQLIIVAQQQQRSERPPPDVETIRAAVTDGVRELLPPLLHDSAVSLRDAIGDLSESLPQRVADAVAPSIVNAVAPCIADAAADCARGASEVAETVGARVSESLRGDLQDAVTDAASTAAARVHGALAAGVEGALRTATDAVSLVDGLGPQLQRTEDAVLAELRDGRQQLRQELLRLQQHPNQGHTSPEMFAAVAARACDAELRRAAGDIASDAARVLRDANQALHESLKAVSAEARGLEETRRGLETSLRAAAATAAAAPPDAGSAPELLASLARRLDAVASELSLPGGAVEALQGLSPPPHAPPSGSSPARGATTPTLRADVQRALRASEDALALLLQHEQQQQAHPQQLQAGHGRTQAQRHVAQAQPPRSPAWSPAVGGGEAATPGSAAHEVGLLLQPARPPPLRAPPTPDIFPGASPAANAAAVGGAAAGLGTARQGVADWGGSYSLDGSRLSDRGSVATGRSSGGGGAGGYGGSSFPPTLQATGPPSRGGLMVPLDAIISPMRQVTHQTTAGGNGDTTTLIFPALAAAALPSRRPSLGGLGSLRRPSGAPPPQPPQQQLPSQGSGGNRPF